MIFVVQRKISSLYHWKKMYMWQLRHILNDSLKLTNLMIPRLAGTPTTNLSLKTFATNTLYRSDFNYNFRKIDSLAISFNLRDFTISGDTVSLKGSVPDSAISAAQAVTAQGASYLIGAYGYHLTATEIQSYMLPEPRGTLYLDYLSSAVDVHTGIANYVTIKTLGIGGLDDVTATDSTLVINTAGTYSISVTCTFADTSTAMNVVYMGVFKNNTRLTDASALTYQNSVSSFGTTTITAIESLASTDILKLKFRSDAYPSDRIRIYNLNFTIHKL
jgi:hypothetical protein